MGYVAPVHLYAAFFVPNRVDPSGTRDLLIGIAPGDLLLPILPPGPNCQQFVGEISHNPRIPGNYQREIERLGPQIYCADCGGLSLAFPTDTGCAICLQSVGPEGDLLYHYEDEWIALLINGVERCRAHVRRRDCPLRAEPIFGGRPPDLPDRPDDSDESCRACQRFSSRPSEEQCNFLHPHSRRDRAACEDAAQCHACRDLCPHIQRWQPACPSFPEWPSFPL